MLRNGHVRFGGRPAETHQFKDWQGAADRPYTYVRTTSGFCYTAFVTDVFSRKIVGWSTRSTMRTEDLCQAPVSFAWRATLKLHVFGGGLV